MNTVDKSSRDPIGDRMKAYETETRLVLPPRTLTAIRIDGRAFHTWTKGMERPYSLPMIEAMAVTTEAICKEVHGSFLAYTQSDEISVLVQDFATADTQPWFGGQLQKICSIAASAATATFARHFPDRDPALFDARVFTLPDKAEAGNYLVWRQRDCQRNAISMIAEQHLSVKELHGMGTFERRRRLAEAGVDLDACDPRFLDGQVIYRAASKEKVFYVDKRTGERRETSTPVVRRRWAVDAAPQFENAPGNWMFDQIPDPVA